MNQSISLANEERALLFKHKAATAWRFVILFLFSIILMMYDHRSHQTEKLRTSLTTVIAPLQFSVSKPIEILEWLKSSFSSHQKLAEENTNLKSQLLLQRAEMQKSISLQKENKQLRALLRSSSTIEGSVKVAQILAVSLDPFLSQVVLDKGKKYGVYLGQPVLDSTGLMGQVIQVGVLTSRVMLVTDSRSAIPVQDSRTGIRAIAIGSGTNRPLMLINVPQTSDVQVGDELITSGLGLNFPVGYPVGIIQKVQNRPGQHFATILVKPSANLEKSRQVLLVNENTEAEYDEAKQQLKDISKEKVNEETIRRSLGNMHL
ncbi:MAG: rod shape-determining protein MreC [Legionellales bacterium]|nr:rod shape-determining protein MreC [Legionellales bacterium]|tara:strand:+ start:231 stop:1184 length:954 start_codon:yes stop_codon:yes gene_type:complete